MYDSNLVWVILIYKVECCRFLDLEYPSPCQTRGNRLRASNLIDASVWFHARGRPTRRNSNLYSGDRVKTLRTFLLDKQRSSPVSKSRRSSPPPRWWTWTRRRGRSSRATRPTSPPPPRRPKSQTASFQKPNHPGLASPATRPVSSLLAAPPPPPPPPMGSEEEPSQMRRALVDSLAGAISGGISRTVTSPLDVIKIRFQVPRSPNIAIPFSWLHLPPRLLRYSLLGRRPLFYRELDIVRSVGWDHMGEFLGMLVCV